MKAKIAIVLFLVVLGLLLEMLDSTTIPGVPVSSFKETITPQKNTVIPNASFLALNKRSYSLHDFKGKIILLNFWASWCAPCLAEFPDLLALAQQESDRVVLLAFSVDEDPIAIDKFLNKLDKESQSSLTASNVIIAHDVNKRISQDLFQSVLYPETFIIGPDLVIQKKIAGVIDWTGEELRSYIKSIK